MIEHDPIAEKVIYAVDKDGRGFDIGLQIGRPYKRTDSLHDEWVCPVALVGLVRPLPGVRGVDSWQAVVLALDLAKNILAAFVESDGGKLYLEKDGAELTLDEAFGIPYKQPAEEPEADRPLTPEQQGRVSRLTPDKVAAIDAAILGNCSSEFRKIARVVGLAIIETEETIPRVPDTFYADRVRHLITQRKLESQGRVDSMRFGEVKLP
jgi:hypothetical protein